MKRYSAICPAILLHEPASPVGLVARTWVGSARILPFSKPIKAKKNDGNDGVSATIRRSPVNCSARIRWRIGAG